MTYKLGFVMEQTLGHVTHAQNLRHWLAMDPEVTATWIEVPYLASDRWGRMPFLRSNWTLLSSLRAREMVVAALRSQPLDALFFHTQVTALFARHLMKAIPTVVSMDATPLAFDSIGLPYNHAPSSHRHIEAIKNAMNRRTFRLAKNLVTWNQWGKESLVRDYGVSGAKVVVIPPGIDLDRWHFPRKTHAGPVRLLFVGGDFKRKGGETLIKAFRQELMKQCELDIVTRDEVDTGGLTGVRVHRLSPNSRELMALYGAADIFVFPTLGDSLPLAIMEAMASSLPVITTSVGAIREQVEDGVTGFLIEPGDGQMLAERTLSLVANEDLRRTMGAAGRRAAGRLFNGQKNYGALLGVIKSCVEDGSRRRSARPEVSSSSASTARASDES
jgi:glycosyltransferase involved in cell wall biosynthesis